MERKRVGEIKSDTYLSEHLKYIYSIVSVILTPRSNIQNNREKRFSFNIYSTSTFRMSLKIITRKESQVVLYRIINKSIPF